MTEYDNMPDAELTRMVAVEVMGPRVNIGAIGGVISLVGNPNRFRPLTDANDRDMVVNAMLERGWNCAEHHFRPSHIGKKHDMHVLCEQFHVVAYADTAGRAVCVAALKAVMSAKEKAT